jgi:hypothetical protein
MSHAGVPNPRGHSGAQVSEERDVGSANVVPFTVACDYTTAWPNNATIRRPRKAIGGIHKGVRVLRDYAPDSDGGAYINEAYHEASFWGTAKAARLKTKYDLNKVFQVQRGICWAGTADVRYECYSRLNPATWAFLKVD